MATILVIEDNEQNLYLTTFILERHGHTVLQARSGEEGISLAATGKPDMILLDVQLPVMDGYAVAQRLKSNPDMHTVPIIAVTSYAMVGDRERVMESGCIGYVEKPINPDTFIHEISVFLNDPNSRRTDAQSPDRR